MQVATAMRTHGLHGKHLGMTFPTFHRIQTAPVPAFCANVAVETFRRAVRGALKERHINFVAIVTRVLVLGVDRL